MKILLLGPKFYGYCDSLKLHLELAGHDVTYYEYGNLYSLFTKITKKYLNVNYKKSIYNYTAIKAKILNEIESSDYDVFLVFKGMMVDLDFLKSIPIRRILWMVDSIHARYYTNIKLLLNEYDRICFFEESDLLKLPVDQRFKFLPMGYDDRIYSKISGIQKKSIDLFFVGSLTKERLILIERILKNFPTLNIKIYGYKRVPTKLMRLRPDVFLNKTLNARDVNIMYNNSKVVLNLGNTQNISSFNPRLLEILGSGATPVTRFTEGTVNYFPFLHEYCYLDSDSLIDAINHALKTPISINLKAHSVRHSFGARIVDLLYEE